MKTVSKTLIAGVITAALVLPASGAFAGERHNQKSDKTEKAILGALIGGIAGAALSKGDGGAIAVGAVAGAALGAASGTDRNDRRYSNSYQSRPTYNGYGQGYQVRDQRYGQGGYDNRYGQNAYDTGYGQRGYDARYSQDRYDARYDDRYDRHNRR